MELNKHQLQKRYKRTVLQLIIEARTLSNFKPQSRLGINARKTIISLGKTIGDIEEQWIEVVGYNEQILAL